MPLRERRTCAKMSSRGQDLHPLPSSLTCLLLLWSTSSAHLHGGSGEVSLLASSPHPTFPRGLAPQTLSWYRGFSLHRNNTVISWNSFDLTACRATCVCTQVEQGCSVLPCRPVLSAALPRIPVSQPGFPSLPTGARQRGIQTLISHLKHSREGSSLGPTFPPTIVFSSFPFPLAGCHTRLTILASAFPPPICRSSSSSTRHPPCPRGCFHPFVVVLLSVRLTQASLLGLRARASSSLQGVSPGPGDPQMPRDWRVHSGAHLAVSPSTPASSAARPPLFSVSVGVFLN